MIITPELAMRSLEATWDRARWETLPDDGKRYEVIDGVLYMSTSPSFFHQWIIRQVARILFAQIDDAGVGLTTWSPIGVFMPGCDPVQPDVVVIRNEDLDIIRAKHIMGVPALLVEVLSPSNPTTDTEVKRRAYARAGVPEYWIIRPASQDALVYSVPDAALGDYAESRHFDAAADLISPTLPIRFAMDGLFAGAPDTTI